MSYSIDYSNAFVLPGARMVNRYRERQFLRIRNHDDTYKLLHSYRGFVENQVKREHYLRQINSVAPPPVHVVDLAVNKCKYIHMYKVNNLLTLINNGCRIIDFESAPIPIFETGMKIQNSVNNKRPGTLHGTEKIAELSVLTITSLLYNFPGFTELFIRVPSHPNKEKRAQYLKDLKLSEFVVYWCGHLNLRCLCAIIESHKRRFVEDHRTDKLFMIYPGVLPVNTNKVLGFTFEHIIKLFDKDIKTFNLILSKKKENRRKKNVKQLKHKISNSSSYA